MRLIRYISSHLLFAFIMALTITTVMVFIIAAIKGLLQFVGGAMGLKTIFTFVMLTLPNLLCLSLPMSLLLATVLVFNRFSVDNEITAMKASGISLLQIISPALFLGMVVTGICWYLQMDLAPDSFHKARWLSRQQVMVDPVSLMEPDVPMELNKGFWVIFGAKEGNTIKDIHIYITKEASKKTGKHKGEKENKGDEKDLGDVSGENLKEAYMQQDITASHGEIWADESQQNINVRLYNAYIIAFDPEAPQDLTRMKRITTEESVFTLNFADHANRKNLLPRPAEMSLKTLFVNIKMLNDQGANTQKLYQELHTRAAWAIAPFTFILIGIPFGLQVARRENTASLVFALLLASGYFISMTLIGEAVTPNLRPEFLIWIPNIALQIWGLTLLWKKR